MFHSSGIPFRDTGVLSKLVSDYLEKDETLRPFYAQYPDVNGFTEWLKKEPYANFDHQRLSEVAKSQAARVGNTSNATRHNLDKLAQKNAYTVTTGHQLCLLTGPLYFVYKIISAINLAETLQQQFPSRHFVPVYWMASEDHDFEEVNHVHLYGKKLAWESTQGGAVGDFKTGELKTLLPVLAEILGTTDNAMRLASLFEKAYLGHTNLAQATRYLVNELFGGYGLVIIDGNDRLFKEQFKEHLKKDVFENLAFLKVNESINLLKADGYDAQVNPRPINCFYLEEGSRKRIELNGSRYQLVGGEKSFSAVEMSDTIELHPERISPNVVLRPMYQQAILPNIAYVGGPGELAYWLEYKSAFDAHHLPFPMLVPRNFILVTDKSIKSKIEKLGFLTSDFFKPELQLVNDLQVKANAVFDLEEEKKTLSALFAGVGEKINAVDKTLSGSVSAELQKALNGLDILSGKANRALKQRLETEISQIKTIRQKLFPDGVPQERHDNFAAFYLKYGPAFFDALKEHIRPLAFDQKLLAETN